MVRVRGGAWTVVAALALLAGCDAWKLTRRHLERVARRAGLEAHTVPVGSCRVHVLEGGEGPPVLLLHGFGGRADIQWKEQFRPLVRSGRRVIVPDLAGFGDTRCDPFDPSIHAQVRLVLGVLDALSVERADVVGVSYGGLVAWGLAGFHPERVGTLVLVDTPGPVVRSVDRATMRQRLGVERIEDLLLPDDADDMRRLLRLAWTDPPPVPDRALESVRAGLFAPHRAEQEALLAWLDREGQAAAARTPAPTAPTVLIWGERDPLFPVEVARRIQGVLGGPSRLEVVPGASHTPNIERPRLFNRLLLEALERPPAPARHPPTRPPAGDRAPSGEGSPG